MLMLEQPNTASQVQGSFEQAQSLHTMLEELASSSGATLNWDWSKQGLHQSVHLVLE
jgi:hypothetical protein